MHLTHLLLKYGLVDVTKDGMCMFDRLIDIIILQNILFGFSICVG